MPHRALSVATCVIIFVLVAIAVGIVVIVLNITGSFTREHQWTAQPGDVGSLWYSPDGKTLFSTGDALRAWDPATGKLKSTIPATGDIAGISPDGNVIAISVARRRDKRTVDYLLELWDVKAAAQLGSINHLVWSVAFSPDGKTLATVTGPEAGGNSTIELWSLPAVLPVASYPRNSPVASVCFSPDGKLLAVAERIAVELLDPTTGKSTCTLTGPVNGFLGSLHFSPDGTTLLALFANDTNRQASLWAWDLSTGQGQQKIDLEDHARVAFYSDDGKTLAMLLISYTFSRHDRVEVWNTTTASRLGSIKVGSPWMSTLALSPDGKHVAVGFQQPGLRKPAPIGIWRLE
jgi:WD40 repeat protein